MTHLRVASLFRKGNNYVTPLLTVGDYGIICANPLFMGYQMVPTQGQEEPTGLAL